MCSQVSLNVYVSMIHRALKGVSSLNVLPDFLSGCNSVPFSIEFCSNDDEKLSVVVRVSQT